MTTSKRDASKAGRLLRESGSKTVRSVAASDLAQSKRGKRKQSRKSTRGK